MSHSPYHTHIYTCKILKSFIRPFDLFPPSHISVFPFLYVHFSKLLRIPRSCGTITHPKMDFHYPSVIVNFVFSQYFVQYFFPNKNSIRLDAFNVFYYV